MRGRLTIQREQSAFPDKEKQHGDEAANPAGIPHGPSPARPTTILLRWGKISQHGIVKDGGGLDAISGQCKQAKREPVIVETRFNQPESCRSNGANERIDPDPRLTSTCTIRYSAKNRSAERHTQAGEADGQTPVGRCALRVDGNLACEIDGKYERLDDSGIRLVRPVVQCPRP